MSPSAMRTSRPNRCAWRAPKSMSRRTVRGDTFKRSAVSSIVRSLVRGRRCPPLPLVRDAAVDADRFGRFGRGASFLPLQLQPRPLLRALAASSIRARWVIRRVTPTR